MATKGRVADIRDKFLARCSMQTNSAPASSPVPGGSAAYGGAASTGRQPLYLRNHSQQQPLQYAARNGSVTGNGMSTAVVYPSSAAAVATRDKSRRDKHSSPSSSFDAADRLFDVVQSTPPRSRQKVDPDSASGKLSSKYSSGHVGAKNVESIETGWQNGDFRISDDDSQGTFAGSSW
jgi:hypothetical protein